MKKKNLLSAVLTVVLALAMCLSLAACGSSAAPAATEAPAADAAPAEVEATADGADVDTDKVFTVGICQLVQHEALDAATQGFMDTLKEKFGDKVVFDVQNAAGDSAACSTIVNSFVSKNVDLIRHPGARRRLQRNVRNPYPWHCRHGVRRCPRH